MYFGSMPGKGSFVVTVLSYSALRECTLRDTSSIIINSGTDIAVQSYFDVRD